MRQGFRRMDGVACRIAAESPLIDVDAMEGRFGLIAAYINMGLTLKDQYSSIR
jgi:hypothetical protein